MNTLSPSWYPDPRNPGYLRYWNGTVCVGDPVRLRPPHPRAHRAVSRRPVGGISLFQRMS
ncbi:MAG: DUF2510 domain-containing protein [Mycobacteriaceae bacterium]|nr:DUF2510 domain-containing protein [Mycobacteriaceae bacterium]